ncbi:hypothetical protein [Nostoc sp.]
MHISLRHLSETDFDFIHEVTKAAMQTYVELTWENWVDEEQRSRHHYKSLNRNGA